MKQVRILALLAALATALGVVALVRSVRKEPAPAPERQVVVAAVDISKNTVIRADMLKTVKLPVKAVLSEVYSDQTDIVGKTVNEDLAAGQQILSSQLENTGTVGSGTLAYSVKSGMRAVTVGVDDVSGLDGMIQPGDRVDVVARLTTTSGGTATAASSLLLQNVTVLAVDRTMTGKTASSDSGGGYKTVTLEVLPGDAVRLCFVQDTGSLRLLLRSPHDSAAADVPPEAAAANQPGGGS